MTNVSGSRGQHTPALGPFSRVLSRAARARGTAAAILALTYLCGGTTQGEEPATLPVRARGPVALTLSPEGDRLYVAQRRGGALSVIDPKAGRVLAEREVGTSLSDVKGVVGGLLALDRAAGALLLLDVADGPCAIRGRLTVAPDPVGVLVAPDGRSCVVASCWSRRITFVAIPGGGEGRGGLEAKGSLGLPFSPREMVLGGPGGANLIVADAFGGKLAVIDREARRLESVRSLSAHNIRGLGVTPDGRTLVVAHQSLNRSARTDFEDVHWGRLLRSHLRALRMDAVLAGGSDDDLLRGGCAIDLGFSGRGAADPSALACGPSGVLAVALGGVDEVALGRSPSGYFRRLAVGAEPSALALSPDGSTLYVAEAFGDSISVVDVAGLRRSRTIELGPRPEPTLAERGERLFHDARLSHDGWMSCHSCHTDGHTNGRLGDTLGDGSYGAPKRVPSLLGAGATAPWSWTGSAGRLEDQVRKSIEVTMWGRKPSDDQVEALAAYVRSLGPPPTVAADGDAEAVARGREVFRVRDCASCHAPPHYTSRGRYDVGLVDEAGNRRFNPPSLRGVGRREPLLHDGRAATLEAVFLEHRHPHESEWTPRELADLIAFLGSL